MRGLIWRTRAEGEATVSVERRKLSSRWERYSYSVSLPTRMPCDLRSLKSLLTLNLPAGLALFKEKKPEAEVPAHAEEEVLAGR